MQNAKFSVSVLLSEALTLARTRWQLIILLGGLYGIASSFLQEPAQDVLIALQDAAGQDITRDFTPIIENGLGFILWGQFSSSAVMALLIVPWARAISGSNILPYDGNPSAMLGRGVRVFWHFLTALVLLLTIGLIGGAIIVTTITMLGGFAISAFVAAGIVALIWLMVVLSCIANFAAYREAHDRPIKFVEAALILKADIGTAAACLVVLWFIVFVFTMIFEGILSGLIPTVPIRISLAISGFFSFVYTATHISVMSRLRP
jgi:hypothetical protein